MSRGPVDPNCLDCGAELHGPYCHSCGQKATHAVLGMHDFAHEVTHEFLHLDGKIWRTVKLLVAKPGELTREFIAGRRARYITPIRVYLTFSVLFFFLAAVVPGARRSFIKIDPGETAALQAEAEREADRIGDSVMKNMPRAAFVLMPFFALLTWLFFRRQQPFYIPHLYYSIHFHAFVFLVLAAAMLLGLIGSAGKVLGSLAFLTIFPYHYIGLRRTFGTHAFLKGTAVGILYWIVLSGTMLAVAWLSMRGLGRG